MNISTREFGRLPDGTAVDLFVLDGGNGLRVSVSTYGAIITSVLAPDRDGVAGEITLAHDTLERYLAGHPYFGAFVGRVANRISGGGVTVDGRFYPLATNAGEVHLHGGVEGFDKKVYSATTETRRDGVFVHLSRQSPDGEEGYPGTLSVRRTVGVTTDNRLVMEFAAETDAATVVNLTDHTYWNLGGATVMDHEVALNAETYVAVDRRSIPTGETPAVAGTPFDFRAYKPVGADFDAVLATGANGFDHSFAITGWSPGDDALREAGRVRSAASGREMIVRTTYPDVHFYTGNYLPGVIGRTGAALAGQEALCLECQFFPDSPARAEFPSIELRPGEVYRHRTEHTFQTF